MKQLLLFLTIILFSSCMVRDENYAYQKTRTNRIYITKSLPLNTVETTMDNYLEDLSNFFSGYFENAPEMDSTKIDIIIFQEPWKHFADSGFFSKYNKYRRNTDRFKDIPKDYISREIGRVGENFVGLFDPKINVILVKSSSPYASYQDLLGTMIVEYNHYFLKEHYYSLSLADGYKFSFFVNEGITNFWGDYFYVYDSTDINHRNLLEFLDIYENLKQNGDITVDKNIVMTGDISVSENYNLQAPVDFQIYLIRQYGYDLYISYIKYLYKGGYNTLDQIFNDCYNSDFNDILTGWYHAS